MVAGVMLVKRTSSGTIQDPRNLSARAKANKNQNAYLRNGRSQAGIHEGNNWSEMSSRETIPPGGWGGGTSAMSPELSRATSCPVGIAVAPCLRRIGPSGRATRRKAPDNARTGSRLWVIVPLTVSGLAAILEWIRWVSPSSASGLAA